MITMTTLRLQRDIAYPVAGLVEVPASEIEVTYTSLGKLPGNALYFLLNTVTEEEYTYAEGAEGECEATGIYLRQLVTNS